MDCIHKTNDHEMSFFVMMGIDGEGESQVLAAFLHRQEDEVSIRKMAQIFKEKNPRWTEMRVVITDKDMDNKSELPQVELQICLFHVPRTFGREVTVDKMHPFGLTPEDCILQK